jgi:cellulose synthase/poly-beta-1,6-N-acetylglucosamine synthase-like glycosyltransferase
MAFLFLPALVLLLLYVLLLGYYHKGFRQLKEYNYTNIKGTTKVSILIPARNEEANILRCLQAIAKQNYPKTLIEVLVIDDFSTDSTAEKVQNFIAVPVKLLQLQHFIEEGSINSYKKKGIEIAIQHATGELIVCTDADCTAKENWISTMVSFYEKTNAQFIAAPVCLTSFTKEESAAVSSRQPLSSWNFVELFQTLDFSILQGITAASVYKNFHTMCNGANIAYTKKAFEIVNGFAGIDSIASGDDMLLMYKIKKQFPTQIGYLKSKEAIVQTATVATCKAFFNQRIRWASKASHYEDKNIFYALLIVYFINVFSLVLLLSLFFAPQNLVWILIFLVVKSMVEFWFLQPVLRFFQQSFLTKWYFVCIPVHIIYTIVAGWLGKFGNYQWKGRVVQ